MIDMSNTVFYIVNKEYVHTYFCVVFLSSIYFHVMAINVCYHAYKISFKCNTAPLNQSYLDLKIVIDYHKI